MKLLYFLFFLPFSYAEPKAASPAGHISPQVYRQIRWWDNVKDPYLHDLIRDGLRNAPDAKIARTRVVQAQAAAGQQMAGFLPSLSASWSSNTQPRDALGFGFGIQSMPTIPGMPQQEEKEEELFTSANAALRLDMPLDIWGRSISNYQAARQDALASKHGQRSALLLLTLSIANAYCDVIASELRLQVVAQQIKSVSSLLEVTKLRQQRGEATALDVLQQEQQLASIGTQMPRAQVVLRTSKQRLSILVGKKFDAELNIAKKMPVVTATNGIQVSDIIRKRPDIMTAKHQLQAAQKRRWSALSNLLPSVAVGAQLSRQSNYVEEEWNSIDVWSVSSSASLTLFQGGAKYQALRSANAGLVAAQENLRAKKLQAEQEVAQAAENEKLYIDLNQAAQTQLSAARRAYQEAKSKYRQGIISFITLLSTQQAHQQAQLNVIQTARDTLSIRFQNISVHGGTLAIQDTK